MPEPRMQATLERVLSYGKEGKESEYLPARTIGTVPLLEWHVIDMPNDHTLKSFT